MRNMGYGLGAGQTHLPKLSVFDGPGMRLNILQTAPLTIQILSTWRENFLNMLP